MLFLKNLGAFKDFRNFFYGNVWVKYMNSAFKFKSIFVTSEGGGNLKGTINFIGDSANTKEIYIYLVDSTS